MLPLAVSLALASERPGLLATEEATLPNGLRVVVHAWPEAPVVAIRLRIPAGSASDPPGRSGLAHLVEHLAFEGSAHAPGNRYDRWLGDAGGSSDAATDMDQMTYSVTVPVGALPLALFLESDRLGWLTPTEAALANQRAVVANERAESARADQVREALAPLLWPEGHPYARRVIGLPEDLAVVTLADVQAFVADKLVPSGATLVIVGPAAPGAVLDEARRWFEDVPDRGSPTAVAWSGSIGSAPDAPVDELLPTRAAWRRGGPGAPAIRAWVPGDVDRVRLRLAWRTFDRGHPDRVALELAGAVLADLLRDDEVDVSAWSGRFGGELSLAANVERAATPLRRIERALEQLAFEGPPDGALERIRATARTWELRGLQTPAGRAAVLLDCAERTGAPDCLPIEWAGREAVDAEAIRRVVRRWLAPGSRVLLAVAPSSRRVAPLPRMIRMAAP
ncbi:MAG: pitrilysin family protein [Pseudomonadota bacterium]|nr:pitrilysin family protein [Pseudomonadota bacterium]